MKQHKDCNFSYAGLKTQVRLAIESSNMYVFHLSTRSTYFHAYLSTRRFHFMSTSVLVLCSDASIPISSASVEDRKLRANIAASFQVMATILCNFFALLSSRYSFRCLCRELQCYIWRKNVIVQLNGH